MASYDEDAAARLVDRYHARMLALRDNAGQAVGRAWDEFGGVDGEALEQFAEVAADLATGAQLQTAALTDGYLADMAGIIADDVAGPLGNIRVGEALRGADPLKVYQRPVITARAGLAKGRQYADASAAARTRAVATAETDVLLAQRATAEQWSYTGRIGGYRRRLTGRSCMLCATASTQRYNRGTLMPIHSRCDCAVVPIIGDADPGRVLNQDLLAELRKSGGSSYWKKAGYVEANPDGTFTVERGGKPTKLQVATNQHGELGPVLANKRHGFDGPDDVPASAAPPKDAKEWAREQATERRRLAAAERKARAAAAPRAPKVDPKDRAAEVAARYGVNPDEVLTAKAYLRELRDRVADDAARVQAESFAALDRSDAFRVNPPPRKGTKGIGGEWDWLEQLDDAERRRLSRRWWNRDPNPLSTVDNIADRIRADTPDLGNAGDDEVLAEVWMFHNRRIEAAGAIRRGKAPSSAAYSGQIDPNDLAPTIRAEGYDVAKVLDDDWNAAGHVATVWRNEAREEASRALGRSLFPQEGPAPWRMSFQSWEEEVRDLDYELFNGTASAAQRTRYGELVPIDLDPANELTYEELYGRIIETAGLAGEEVPSYARIPW